MQHGTADFAASKVAKSGISLKALYYYITGRSLKRPIGGIKPWNTQLCRNFDDFSPSWTLWFVTAAIRWSL